jgi:UDP-N-acetylmuramoylalanine--D-glutamate ligase
MTKTVLVYGTGISGCGAADALAKQGCRVLLYSDKETKIDNALLELLKKQGGGLWQWGNFAAGSRADSFIAWYSFG